MLLGNKIHIKNAYAGPWYLGIDHIVKIILSVGVPSMITQEIQWINWMVIPPLSVIQDMEIF